jgi:hypothetical protein
MPNKKMVLIFLAGWALAFIIPPQTVLGAFRKSS